MRRKPSPVAAVAITSDRKWEAEDALRTLMRAKEIEGDAKLMKSLQELARQRHEQLGRIARKKI